MTILLLFLLFVMLPFGPFLALLAYPSREGQVNVAHATETLSRSPCSQQNMPSGLPVGPERQRTRCV